MNKSDTRFRLKELVTTILKTKGLTQFQFAEKVGTSEKVVCRVLNGHANLTIKTAIIWEKILGVTAENLIYSQTLDEISEERAIQRGDLKERIAEMPQLEEVS